MPLPIDYCERVYAGVLGKIIGVYLGRPFEGWEYERILNELGEIEYYVHQKLNKPLIVTDDDIAGTFTFLRAISDHGNRRDITPAQIGQTWLNYLIEKRTILWWGGLGNSTEHTAYLRLRNGILAPFSGSIETNGKVVAEQIGAQIFIDGWAMVAPGDPEFAVDLARRAASVSHDGEAIYGAQVLAAMESQAFYESNLNKILDTAVSFIPHDSVIYRMIADLRDWRARYQDWHFARQLLADQYGYQSYGGNCHIVPNHGLIQLALLYGEDNFQKSLMIVNTCGWDTDCNSGNVGCLLGIKNGLPGIDAGPDWRGPVADRIYISSADGGRAITDAAREAYAIVNIGRALDEQIPLSPKNNARFHFELPGSVHGFKPELDTGCHGSLLIQNAMGHSQTGTRSLSLIYQARGLKNCVRASTPTFVIPDDLNLPGYELLASPTLYQGQVIRARVSASEANEGGIAVKLYLNCYGENDTKIRRYGPGVLLKPGNENLFEWQVQIPNEEIIYEIGLELNSPDDVDGIIYLDYLTWDGIPKVTFERPKHNGSIWRKIWVSSLDYDIPWASESFRMVQDEGLGLLIQGGRDWADYFVEVDITPHMVKSVGLAARVQGLKRYYALVLARPDLARLVKVVDEEKVLSETCFDWYFGNTYTLRIEATSSLIRAFIDGTELFTITDPDPLTCGGIALICEEGRAATDHVSVGPLN